MTDDRLHLATWNERLRLGIKNMRCPQCQRMGYKPYVYADGQVIDASCGKCDHEGSCGYHLPPKEFFRLNPQERGSHVVAVVPQVQMQRISIPLDYVRRSMPTKGNVLLKYLRSLPMSKGMRENFEAMVVAYAVGTTKAGDTIWWQIDKQGEVRSGKIMRYNPDGHRWKDSSGRGFGNWVHSILQKQGVIGGADTHQYVGCLFGEHLLSSYPKAEVHIVESEKSALICAAFDQSEARLWMAVGGMMCLSRERLLPLIEEGRTIVVYPDHDGFKKWSDKVAAIGEKDIIVSPFVEQNYEEGVDPANADIADILLRRLGESDEVKLRRMVEKNPALQTMIDKLDLEPWHEK